MRNIVTVPSGGFPAGEQLVFANAARAAAVPGFLKIWACGVSVYRHVTPVGGSFGRNPDVMIISPKIKAGDRVYQLVRGRWQLFRPFRIVNGKAIIGFGSSGLLEIVS